MLLARPAPFKAASTIQNKRLPQVLQPRTVSCRALQTKETETSGKNEAEVTAEKFGLEAGLWKVITSKPADGKISKAEQTKQLLTQYGSAYLLTSISFAIVSFAACYAAVNSGVDVAALLAKVGIEVNNTNESVGTFALAYAAHKALSPVRFPPTVALTPVVAKLLKKEGSASSSDSADQ